jgi:2,3-dihydroxybiphenyl 1,2-dioxygenase
MLEHVLLWVTQRGDDVQLGFLVFEVSDLGAWRSFLTEILGLVEVDGLRFRLDSRVYRIQLQEGPADDLAAVGWEVDEATFDAIRDRLHGLGVAAHEADATDRLASRRLCFTDPAGIPVEVVTGLARADEPFASPLVPSGFIAEEHGLGHLVLSTRSKQDSVRFYTEVLGIRLSDHIVCEVYGHPVDLSFFHVNGRHHSVAFGGPQRKRLHHFMIEVRDMDEVGLAHDRTLRAGLRITQTIGRHPNDQMFSFYARTPSKFEFELGWGGRVVDDRTWTPTTYGRISDWGHHPPQLVYGSPR